MKINPIGTRILSVAFLLAGLGMIYFGYQRASTPHDSMLSVERYFDALVHGDQSGIVAELSPSVRGVWLENQEHLPTITPRPDLKCKVKSIKIDALRATIRTEISRDLYRIEPIFQYERQANGDWRIVSIENLKPDATWERAVREMHQQADDSLAEELTIRLSKLPGVSVKRSSALK